MWCQLGHKQCSSSVCNLLRHLTETRLPSAGSNINCVAVRRAKDTNRLIVATAQHYREPEQFTRGRELSHDSLENGRAGRNTAGIMRNITPSIRSGHPPHSERRNSIADELPPDLLSHGNQKRLWSRNVPQLIADRHAELEGATDDRCRCAADNPSYVI